jgi:hypothetical protein
VDRHRDAGGILDKDKTMTSRDSWIVEQAQKNKAALSGKPLTAKLPNNAGQIDDLWTSLQREVARLAGIYNDALGARALSVKTEGDRIEIEHTDGRRLVIALDRDKPGFTERYRNAAGLERLGSPRIKFASNSTGDLGFSFGGVADAAGSLMRRLVS